MSGAPNPLKVGGLRPPTFPGTCGLTRTATFSILTLRTCVFVSFPGAQLLIQKFLNPITTCRTKGVNREDASDQVRAGLGSMPGKAGKQGYGQSPELSLKSATMSWSACEGWTRLERS